MINIEKKIITKVNTVQKRRIIDIIETRNTVEQAEDILIRKKYKTKESDYKTGFEETASNILNGIKAIVKEVIQEADFTEGQAVQ